MNKSVLIGILIAGAGGLLSTSAFQVAETEFAVVTRLGDPHRVVEQPGLYFKLPYPIDSAIPIDRRINVLDAEPAEYLTRDKKNVMVDAFAVWSVADPLRFLVSVNDAMGAEARLQDVMRSEIGTILGSNDLAALVSAQPQARDMEDIFDEISASTAARVSQSFGIDVSAVRIKRLHFPSQNQQAVFRRMAAERDRMATLYRSEGAEEAARIRAQADREQAEIIAEAERIAEETRGRADAEATGIYAEAFGQDPDFYEFLRSLEAYDRIIKEDSTVVVPSDSDLLKILRDPDRFTGGGQ